MSPKWLVAGGGISGLAAAQCLQANGRDYLLLERCPAVGGLTRTTQVEDFCFDYTGHFLHLRRYPSPAQVPFAHLNDDDWETVERKSYFFAGGHLITAPIQYHLGELPEDLRAECEKSYDERPKVEGDVTGFRDFIVSGFGQSVADRFLIPQNEKTMATPLDRLSIGAVKRFFPLPDEDRIRAGFANTGERFAEYNTTFWYPKRGSIDVLTRGLAHGLKSVATTEEIAAIDLDRRIVTTSSGRSVEWERMFPSIPLKALCMLTRDTQLTNAAAKLSHSSTISFNFGVRGKLPSELKDAHWVYVPDRDIPFYRFGCYSNISAAMSSPGMSAVYVEVGVPGESIARVDIISKTQRDVVAALEALGWVKSEDIICAVTHVIRCAYVHHTPERDRLVDEILARLNAFGIHPIGRYGLWDYVGMEDSISSALTTVEAQL
ncbi:NAD(P)/FAD-dependent oxidoreductase [Hyphomicrobium sp.]|jgi:protoporphyrinogen oxidase|uniref:protoporphyrinogen/coproporphyrinogen oxidase n=1 Tax=Hyphomicrobium sp. TaxID=82 RepID=UPI0035696C22